MVKSTKEEDPDDPRTQRFFSTSGKSFFIEEVADVQVANCCEFFGLNWIYVSVDLIF